MPVPARATAIPSAVEGGEGGSFTTVWDEDYFHRNHWGPGTTPIIGKEDPCDHQNLVTREHLCSFRALVLRD